MSKAHRHTRRAPVAAHPGRPGASRARTGPRFVWVVVAALALVVSGVWAYSDSFAGVFVFDDISSIVDNPHTRSLWPLGQAMTAPPETGVSGRPVVSLTLALNYALAPADARAITTPAGGPGAPPDAADRFARNIWGYHAVNLAIHLGAALLLFGVIRRSLRSEKLANRFGRDATALAFVASLVWLVHPLNTGAVTYLVQRIESLMGLFYLLTLYCAIRAALSERWRGWWTAGSIAACALGMGTKEVMVSAPIMVWLWDVTIGTGTRRRWPLYSGLAASWVILGGLVVSESRPNSVGFHMGWTAWSYLETQAGVIGHYLRLAAVPSPLVLDYGWQKAQSIAEVAWPLVVLAVLAGATAVAMFRRKPAGLPGAWFFLILAPTSSILPIVTEIAAEHRMYLPLAAVVVCAVAGAYAIAGWLLQRVSADARRRRLIGSVAAVIAVFLCATTFAEMTRARNLDYASEEGLWRDTIAKRPRNAHARVNYGGLLLASGRWQEAEAQLRAALDADAANSVAHMQLGSALAAQGKLDEGISHLERAISLDPRLSEAYGLLGQSYADQGKRVLAARYLLRAAEMMPPYPPFLSKVSLLLATAPEDAARNGAKAVELAERAVLMTERRDPIALHALAAALAELNRYRDASAVIREAMAISQAQGDAATASELAQRLALYQAGRKLRAR